MIRMIILFSFCSRHVPICLVRTTEVASLFTKQTAMFASAMKDSQEDTAKWVRTLKGRLGSTLVVIVAEAVTVAVVVVVVAVVVVVVVAAAAAAVVVVVVVVL